MKTLLFLVAFAALILSCSKPGQEAAATTDSVATAPANNNNESESKGRTPVTLTATEAERVEEELLVFIHNGMTSDNTVALVEDYSFDENKFKCTIIISNLDNGGVSSGESYSGNIQPSEEQIQAYEADTSKDKEYPMGEAYTRNTYYYTAPIDTFYIDGDYTAYVDDPESTPRVLTIELGGAGITHQNDAEVDEDGVPRFNPQNYWYFDPDGRDYLGADSFTVNLGELFTFKPDDLYIKAKIKDLTDTDLAGLSKEQLGFVRNDIFARHGHTFKLPKSIMHYQPLPWYHSVVADATPLLNKFEKRNVEFIKKRES